MPKRFSGSAASYGLCARRAASRSRWSAASHQLTTTPPAAQQASQQTGPLLGCTWLFNAQRILSNGAPNLLTLFPADVAFVGMRNQRRPLLLRLTARMVASLTGHIAQHL